MDMQILGEQDQTHLAASVPRLLLRSRAESFEIPNPAVRKIQFLHPGYPDNQNILLILPAFDSGGIHYETARIACGILANCRWDGYLSATRNGPRLSIAVDGILLDSSYYFCIDGESNYPITPSFEHFRFPTRLPDSWSSDINAPIQPATSDRVPDRDQTCRITCSSLPNEIAHVVPAAQEDWWRANSMFLHASRPESSIDTNCPDNAILLRRDLHYLWDNHKFAIVPKQGRWVVHVLNNLATNELQERYHNLETQPIIGVAREFLLARFALAVLAEKSIFAKQGFSRNLIILEDNIPQLKVLSGEECRNLFGPRSKSRSQSPKKRQRSIRRDEDENVPELSSVSSAEETWEAEQWSQPTKRERSPSLAEGDYLHSYLTEEEEHRGRSRKRRHLSPNFDEVTKDMLQDKENITSTSDHSNAIDVYDKPS